jgi:hypothetical protein
MLVCIGSLMSGSDDGFESRVHADALVRIDVLAFPVPDSLRQVGGIDAAGEELGRVVVYQSLLERL